MVPLPSMVLTCSYLFPGAFAPSDICIPTIIGLHCFFGLYGIGRRVIECNIGDCQALPEGQKMVVERHEYVGLPEGVCVQTLTKSRRQRLVGLERSLRQPDRRLPPEEFKGSSHLFLTLGTRGQIPGGHMLNILWSQTTLDHNVPSNKKLGTF